MSLRRCCAGPRNACRTQYGVTRSRLLATCSLCFSTTNVKDINTSISLITRIYHLYFVCSVRSNGYQRVDVPGSRKMAGIVPPLEWRSARNIGIDELQRSTWCICIVFFLLTKNGRHGQFQFSFCTLWILRTCLSMLMVCPTVCLYIYTEVFLRLMKYLTKTEKDLERARPAFTLISQSRRLPALLENFLGTFAQNLSNTRLSDPTFTRGYAEELLPG